MPTLVEERATRSPADTAAATNAARLLRTSMAAIRLSFTWFGVRKSLTPAQKDQAAEAFGAQGHFLSAGKKLFDTQHEAFRAVTTARHELVKYLRRISLPFPEPGIRLIRQDDLGAVTLQLTTLKSDLTAAVERLDQHFGELRLAARERLGSLYNPDDYPASLTGLFEVAWDFPSVEPPPYLQRLSPQLYQQECQRVAARFDAAVQLAEQAFVEELAQLVSHLTERLSGSDDGQPRVFRDSAVENLTEFFQRFRHLNIRSNEQLDELVTQAQQIVRGVEPRSLRESEPLRQRIATELSAVGSVLDGLLVDRPRRAILRRPR
jgi:hypothetical protein